MIKCDDTSEPSDGAVGSVPPSCSSGPSKLFTLEARTSTIPNAGYGLFVSGGAVPEGATACVYGGRRITTREVMGCKGERAEGEVMDGGYLMRVGYSERERMIVWVDASEELSVIARYINDPLMKIAYNVKFVKDPESGTADVVAVRDIVEGEELFVDYGKGYWMRGGGKKLSLADLGKLYSGIRKSGIKLPKGCDDMERIADAVDGG